MRQLLVSRCNINKVMTNLLPLQKKKAIAKIYRLRVVAVTCFTLASVIIVALVLLLPSFFILETEKRTLETQLEGLIPHEASAEVIDTDAIIAEVEEELEILGPGIGSSETVSYIHEVLLGYKTENIAFDRFLYSTIHGAKETSTEITVSGRAFDRKSLELFVESLNQDPMFADIDDPISNYINERDLPFSIIINSVQHED